MSRRVRLSSFSVAAALLVALLPASAYADSPTTQLDDPRGRQFFEVGQQAYEKSQYPLAIEAFEHAYAIVPRPGLLFSLGQAHQRQFRAHAVEQELTAAITYYRAYLAADGAGRRRAEALAAIETLAAIQKQLHPPGSESPAQSIFGKLLVSSPTPNVRVSVAGEPVDSLPAAIELPAKTYQIDAEALGYAPEHRTLRITPGLAVPLNLELKALPATLVISGPPGAEAFLDGQPLGFMPVPTLTVPAGQHAVSLRQPGRVTRSVRLDLHRGQRAHADLQLETTTQRRAAWVLAAGGGVTLAATTLFAGLAAARDSSASSLERQRQRAQLSLSQADQLNSAVDARDRFRTLAVIGGITSAALFGSALVLYFSETPATPEGKPVDTAKAQPRLQWGVSAVGFGWGASLTQTF